MSICSYSVSIGCCNTNHWRVPHGRDDEITQRIMIGTLPLSASLTETNGGLGFPEIVRTGGPFPAQLPIGAKVISQAGIGGVLVEGEQSKSGEVLGLVDFNERSGGRVIEVTGQTCEALIGLLIESSIQGTAVGLIESTKSSAVPTNVGPDFGICSATLLL